MGKEKKQEPGTDVPRPVAPGPEPDKKTELTVEQLKGDYPDLVGFIRDEMIEELESVNVAQFRETFPEQEKRLARLITTEMAAADLDTFCSVFAEQVKKLAAFQMGSNLRKGITGFLLEIGDPFAAGTLRTYERLSKKHGLKLPYVLPYKDKVTIEAINNYIVRASGAGDIERVKRATKALEKCKKSIGDFECFA